MKWIGIGVDLFVVGFGTPYRFAERLQAADHIDNKKTQKIVSVDTVTAIILALIAGLFLVDSFRRIRTSFSSQHAFSANRQIMVLYVIALLF